MPPPSRGSSNLFNNQQSSLPLRHLPLQGGPNHHGSSLPPPSHGVNPAFSSLSAHQGASNQANLFSSGFALNGVTGGTPMGGHGGGIGGGGAGLASQAAQMGFANAGHMGQGGGMHGADARLGKGRIREVWRTNLRQEMVLLRQLIEKYPIIAMDTEFPGIIARPMGSFTSKADYHYQTLRCNVDLLNMIQLGITLFTEDGETPPPHPPELVGSGYVNSLSPCPFTWQFNFRFSLEEDMYSQSTIELLTKAGLDFQLHEMQGIDPFEFGSLIISSGLVLNDDARWISLHSGYDVAHLAKMMLCRPLPEDEAAFKKLIDVFFPRFYDVKFLINSLKRSNIDSPLSPQAAQIITNLGNKTHLHEIADEFGLKTRGTNHQAGYDSFLLGQLFFKIRTLLFAGEIDDSKYQSRMWGLNGVGNPASSMGTNLTLHVAGQGQGQGQGQGHHQSALNGNAQAYTNGSHVPSTPNSGAAQMATTPGGQGGNAFGLGGQGVFGQFYHKR